MNLRLAAGLRSAALCLLSAAAVFGQTPTVVTTLPSPTGQPGVYGTSFTRVGDAVYFYADPPYDTAAIWKWTEQDGVVRVKTIPQDNYNYVQPALMAFGDKLLFGGRVSSLDYELWITDGTSAGTTLVKDIYTGGSSFPVPVIVVGTKAYFMATDLEHGRELWVTDGTPGGTTFVTDLTGDSASSSPTSFVTRNGLVYFTALGQLFVTDGTAAGTLSLATGVNPGSTGVLGGQVVFLGSDETNGRELWSTDGTLAGTALLKDINPGPASSWGGIGTAFVKRGSSLIFFAEDAVSGREVWITDGTANGTALVKDVMPGPDSSQLERLVASDDGAFFIVSGTGLWFSDGTENGTIPIATYTSVSSMVAAPNGAYLLASTGSGSLLRFSDGTVAGTVDFPGLVATAPLYSTGGLVLFNAGHETYGGQPWITDGSEAGTHALPVLTGTVSYAPPWVRAAGSNVFMAIGTKLFRSDGTAPGTFEVGAIGTIHTYSYTNSLASVGNLFLFHSPGTSVATAGLWKSDGTPAGTGLVKQFYNIDSMASTGLGYALMYARETSSCCSDTALWRTDGTLAGTTKLAALYEPHSFVELGGRVYFLTGSTYSSSASLWRTEGTAGTTSVILPGQVGAIGAAGGRLYLSKTQTGTGQELWISDGTADGMALLKDINPGNGSSQPATFASIGKIVVFTADDGTHGRELWRSDGTEAGTFLLRDIYVGESWSGISGLTQSGKFVYFMASDNVNGRELWRTDGTVAGTIRLSDVTDVTSLIAVDGKLVFIAQTPTYGIELWESDGTPAGTFLVADVVPGAGSLGPSNLTVAGNKLFFTTPDAKLWTRARAASRLTVADRRVTEGDSGSAVVQFTVTREGSTAGAASVNFTTEDLTATAGSDYQATSGLVSFASGETTKQIAVTLLGDTTLEQNEAFSVLLTTATGATIVRDRALGIIEENDRKVALSVAFVPRYSDNRRRFRITNAGPSLATVTLRVSESPYPVTFQCDGKNPSTCNVGAVPAGESVDFEIERSYPWSSDVETNPGVVPGRTLTARVSALEAEVDLSDNETSRMVDTYGTYSLPPYLVAGTNDTAQVTTYTYNFPTTVGLGFSNGVIVSPSSALLTENDPIATFGLTIAPEAWGWTNALSGPHALMRVPIVLPSETAKLDTVLVPPPWHQLSFEHGEPVVLPVAVSGVLPDGTRPSGVVSLRKQSDDALVQNQVLDADGKATFTVNGLPAGTHLFKVDYPGDARFNELEVNLNTVRIYGVSTATVLVVQHNPCGVSQIVITVKNVSGGDTPTGAVVLNIGGIESSLPLVATATPGQAQASTSYTFTSGSYTYLYATYTAESPFGSSSDSESVSPTACPAPTLIASAVSGTSVSLIWSNVGADLYDVMRADGPSISAFTVIGTTALTNFTDPSAAPGRAYLYKVAAKSSSGVVRSTSASDLATTVIFSDDPIAFRSTIARAAHILELRQAANALRALTGQVPLTFPALAPGMRIKASDITGVRSAIGAALSSAGRPAVVWIDGVAPGMPVRTLHIQQMRNVVK